VTDRLSYPFKLCTSDVNPRDKYEIKSGKYIFFSRFSHAEFVKKIDTMERSRIKLEEILSH